MVPSSFVFLDALPLLPNGKVDRAALASFEDAGSSREARTFTPPRTTAEQRLAAIWCEVLGVENIGVHENFFTELGGHSLLATRLMSRVRSAFRLDLPLRVLFRSPTIAKLAEEVEEALLREVDALSDESARSLLEGQVS
jgi:acyl carrier protein